MTGFLNLRPEISTARPGLLFISRLPSAFKILPYEFRGVKDRSMGAGQPVPPGSFNRASEADPEAAGHLDFN